jgi:hypothetical protein
VSSRSATIWFVISQRSGEICGQVLSAARRDFLLEFSHPQAEDAE